MSLSRFFFLYFPQLFPENSRPNLICQIEVKKEEERNIVTIMTLMLV